MDRYADSDDDVRCLIKLRSVQFKADVMQKLYDFVEEFLSLCSCSFPSERNIESQIKFIISTLPIGVKEP